MADAQYRYNLAGMENKWITVIQNAGKLVNQVRVYTSSTLMLYEVPKIVYHRNGGRLESIRQPKTELKSTLLF